MYFVNFLMTRCADLNFTTTLAFSSSSSCSISPGSLFFVSSSSCSVSKSLVTCSAIDTAFVVTMEPQNKLDKEFWGTYNRYEVLRTLEYWLGIDWPSATDVCTLLNAVHRHCPTYKLNSTQCYWFAATILNIIFHKFSNATLILTDQMKRKGTCSSFMVKTESSGNDIVVTWTPEQQTAHEQTGKKVCICYYGCTMFISNRKKGLRIM